MPEDGKYEKLPRPESIEMFIKYLNSNKIVTSIDTVSAQTINIHRNGKKSLLVYMSNIYIVSLADVHEIRSEVPNLDAIVTLSAWNGYTQEAKSECKDNGIGLFKFKEFLGAVYLEDNKFINHISSEERKRREK